MVKIRTAMAMAMAMAMVMVMVIAQMIPITLKRIQKKEKLYLLK